MPDDKKKSAKPAGGQGIESEIFFVTIITLALLFIIFPTVLQFFNINLSLSFSWDGIVLSLQRFISELFSATLFLSLFSCLVIGMALFYAKFRLKETTDAYNAKLTKATAPSNPLTPFNRPLRKAPENLPGAVLQDPPMPIPEHPRWKNIEENMNSSNAANWRLAILEADIMLFDMLEQIGYPGQTVAEKLKQANSESFSTLNDAWRAHKVRNIIAHEGAAFNLSRSQAEETIANYKKVFEEFYFI